MTQSPFAAAPPAQQAAPNPFAAGPQAAPQVPQQQPAQISDAAAQEFGAQQSSPFAQAAAPEIAQMQNPVQNAFAAQQQAAPQGFVQQSAPWTPQQHETYNQMREGGMAAAPQGFAPQVSAPAPQQAPPAFGGFAQQQQAAPAQASSPFAGVTPGAGGRFDPAMFNAPTAGTGGPFPKVRDLDGRLCLFRVKERNRKGTAYGDSTQESLQHIANVAVLDGGPLYASPSAEDVMGKPELVSETVPYVIPDMIIGQIGLRNRLKEDFVRGRIMRQPKGALEKQLQEAYPGLPSWQALFTALTTAQLHVSQLVSGTYFWTIVPDDSEQAGQLVGQFAQNPVSRELML